MAIGLAGGSQPHNNMQPYLVMNYTIALEGVFPARN
jgi:microcystin-dependent protein